MATQAKEALNSIIEIQGIQLTQLNNAAHYQFIADVQKLVKDNEALKKIGTLNIAVGYLNLALETEDRCYKLSQKSHLSDKIKEADRERDRLLRAYVASVKSHIKSPLTDLAEAAKVLNQHVKDFRIDASMPYDQETGAMSNLTADLATKYKTQVERLGLKAYADAMRTANDRVAELISTRLGEQDLADIGALRAARRDSDAAYLYLVRLVNAFALATNPGDFRETVDALNKLVKRYKEQNMPRSHKKKDADKPDDTSAAGEHTQNRPPRP